ncbi:hypothetical protein QS257_19065 [Terrilactibacillus sp. S3-3]|nr:hypothetical protein QS257_19065 [Terrilactibacillus sp. S3-3]
MGKLQGLQALSQDKITDGSGIFHIAGDFVTETKDAVVIDVGNNHIKAQKSAGFPLKIKWFPEKYQRI